MWQGTEANPSLLVSPQGHGAGLFHIFPSLSSFPINLGSALPVNVFTPHAALGYLPNRDNAPKNFPVLTPEDLNTWQKEASGIFFLTGASPFVSTLWCKLVMKWLSAWKWKLSGVLLNLAENLCNFIFSLYFNFVLISLLAGFGQWPSPPDNSMAGPPAARK